jgi:hypothetical protein
VKTKQNIFEEINKMKNLMNAKSGTVISEQDAGYVAGMAAAGAAAGAAFFGVGAIPGAIIGGAIGLIGGLINNSSSSEGAKRILQACGSKETVGPPSQSRQQLNAIADGLNKAIEGVGTDEDAIKANLQKITTIPDLCAMSNIYQTRHGESLWDALDGDIDEQQEWKNYVYLPLLDAYENSVELGKKVKAAPAGAATPAKGGAPAKGGGQRAQGGGQRAQGGGQSSVNSRFASTAQSLGVQNAKMDVATLQTMLKTLEGGASSTPAQGTPDATQLTAALNQLK